MVVLQTFFSMGFVFCDVWTCKELPCVLSSTLVINATYVYLRNRMFGFKLNCAGESKKNEKSTTWKCYESQVGNIILWPCVDDILTRLTK